MKEKEKERNFISAQTSSPVNKQQAIHLAEEEETEFSNIEGCGFWLTTQLSEAGSSLCKAQLSSSKEANC